MAESRIFPSAAYLVLGALAAVGLGIGWSSAALGGGAEAEVGVLEPVYAAPAERARSLELGRGETLGRILWNEAELDGNEQEAFLAAFREEASPRRLDPGTPITLRRRTDDGWLRGVDVRLNADVTVRLERHAPREWSASRVVTPVESDTLFVSGRIDDILWTSILEDPDLADLPALDRVALIHRLDQVFQWQIDFSRQIREGDVYRFVFEREVRPDGSMRSGRLLAAQMVNQGASHHAIFFDPNGDGAGTYYDLEGQSVRRAFLRKPLQFRYISSRFSSGRLHPILKRRRAHRGVDYAASRGTPVMATGDGVVSAAGRDGGYGNLLEIRHPNGFRTRYGHLSGFADGVRVGARVEQGDVVAYVGATGLATGPHLHYEMHRAGRAVDPLAIELPPGDPVPAEQRQKWEDRLASRLQLLDRLPDPRRVRMAGSGDSEAERTGVADGDGQ